MSDCVVCGAPAGAEWCDACLHWADGNAFHPGSYPGMYAGFDAAVIESRRLMAAADPNCTVCSAPGFRARGWTLDHQTGQYQTCPCVERREVAA